MKDYDLNKVSSGDLVAFICVRRNKEGYTSFLDPGVKSVGFNSPFFSQFHSLATFSVNFRPSVYKKI